MNMQLLIVKERIFQWVINLKHIKKTFVLLFIMLLLCSCGISDKDYIIPDCTKSYMDYCGITKFEIVEIGKYDNLKLDVNAVTVLDEEVSDNIVDLLESYAYMEPVQDRNTVIEGDFVSISYDVCLENEVINTVSGDSLKVGAGYYDEEIESGLIDKKVGEMFSMQTIDDETGKELMLNIKVDSIQKFITFSLDDAEFLNDVLGYSSEDELKNAVKEQIRQTKEAEAQSEAEHKLLLKIIDDSDIEFNEKEVAEYAKQQVELYEQIASANNLSLEEYYTQNLKLNKEEFYQKCYNDAEEELAEELVVGAIAELENIQVEDEVPEKESELTQEEIIQNNVKNQQNLRKKVFETVF